MLIQIYPASLNGLACLIGGVFVVMCIEMGSG